jgi:hypothetical protein
MKARDEAQPGDGRWDGKERRLRPRSPGWGRGAAAAFERMRDLESLNPPVPDPGADPQAGRPARKAQTKD